jgi:hypothetical protein
MSNSSLDSFRGNISYNAQHSPLGAFFSFTCGLFGSRGGFGLQIGCPGNQNLFIGVKEGNRDARTPLKCLPFYEGASSDEAQRYDVENKSSQQDKSILIAYPPEQIVRRYGWATDEWDTGDFRFTLYSPFFPVPESMAGEAFRRSIMPAIVGELMIDNTQGVTPKTGVFAIYFPDPGARLSDDACGFSWRGQLGVRAELISDSPTNLETVMRWAIQDALCDPNPRHGLGNTPGLFVTIPPGQKATIKLALGVYLDHKVTTRLEGRYLYTRVFGSLEDVLETALTQFNTLKQRAQELDKELASTSLSPDQQWLIAHSTRSYHGSTQLLDVGGEPFWIVNEGEYCMMNTLDLSVDQVFWELRQHPWLVRNLLDRFVRHYSYIDCIKVPKNDKLKVEYAQQSGQDSMAGPRVLGRVLPMDAFELKPGGISFCHDMGVHNQFHPQGHSSYELPNLVGCFSYMTCEELCNWVLCAASYVAHTGDVNWTEQNESTIRACLESLINRSGEAGYVMYDSSRCQTGAEITTYDSLDHSLAQTRNNLYMAVKCWATYLGLELLLKRIGHPSADKAKEQAKRCMTRIVAQTRPEGILPAVFESDNPGFHSRILPAIEGLVYPAEWKIDVSSYQPLYETLKKHTLALLKDPQKRNLFPDGGIRLSSTSDNSWMSKIAIFQYVCRKVLGLDSDPYVKQLLQNADAAHVKWMTDGESAYWACSDQFVNGVAKGSKYYPRIVTTILWMTESKQSS